MISRNKREKQEHSKNLLLYLWRGENAQAMNYLSMEKAVDIVVGHLQKRKGMSWSSLGSNSHS